jgi:protein disulfide-isomerase A6
LTEDNFDEKVMKSKEIWMVEFYAPWCGHCKDLEPEYKSAATQLRGQKVNLGLVDATLEEYITSRFDVKGFPHIIIFNYGLQNKKDSKAHVYTGPRTSKDIVGYLSDLAE